MSGGWVDLVEIQLNSYSFSPQPKKDFKFEKKSTLFVCAINCVPSKPNQVWVFMCFFIFRYFLLISFYYKYPPENTVVQSAQICHLQASCNRTLKKHFEHHKDKLHWFTDLVIVQWNIYCPSCKLELRFVTIRIQGGKLLLKDSNFNITCIIQSGSMRSQSLSK